MRWTSRRGIRALLATVTAVALSGADGPPPSKATAKFAKTDEILSDICDIQSAASLKVQGVGLVIGLDNTGSDPEPGPLRTKILDEMRKAKVERPNDLLGSKWCSLVIVKATIPPGVNPSDHFVVEISTPPTSTTTSLVGGYLLLTDLAEMAVAGGEVREGQIQAVAVGPVMVGTADNPGDLRSGRVLEGGSVKKEAPYKILIKEGRKSGQVAKLIESTINRRFHGRKGVNQSGMANAKSTDVLELNVPKVYHQNQIRYFQIVRLMQLANRPELVEEWTTRWGKDLLDPKKAGIAALQLEGIGPNAIPALKGGLNSPDVEVRYRAAEALAYLGDSAGVDILTDTVASNADYRIFALTALAAMDQPAAVIRLRTLMGHPDLDVRYGAFSALKAVEPTNPYLGRVRLVNLPEEEEDEDDPAGDAMALKFGPKLTRRPKGPAPTDPFQLYVVEGDGPPSIHVSKSKSCEIVLFGRGLELLTPVVLGGAGSIQVNAAEGDRKVEISRIEPNRVNLPDRKLTSPNDLAAVLRQLVQLGATYPEVVALMENAEAQRNLPGPLAIDSRPKETGKYLETQLAGSETVKTKIDNNVGKAAFEKGTGSTDGAEKGKWRFKLPTLPRPNLNPMEWFGRRKTAP